MMNVGENVYCTCTCFYAATLYATVPIFFIGITSAPSFIMTPQLRRSRILMFMYCAQHAQHSLKKMKIH